jgi:hypothetical protein
MRFPCFPLMPWTSILLVLKEALLIEIILSLSGIRILSVYGSNFYEHCGLELIYPLPATATSAV